jgi:hypothetical protein
MTIIGKAGCCTKGIGTVKTTATGTGRSMIVVRGTVTMMIMGTTIMIR